jgi:hypothetical protein
MSVPLFCFENRASSFDSKGILSLENESLKIEEVIKTKDIIVLDNVLSPEECDKIINSCNPKVSIIKDKRFKVCSNFKELSEKIQERCKEFIPGSVYKESVDNDVFHFTGHNYWVKPEINSDWRFVKCDSKAPMSRHFDGVLVKSVDHKSIYTLMIYLSDNNDGGTRFINENITVLPKKGRVCIFNQNLIHEGLSNSKEKYLMRSEILYHREHKIETEDDRKALTLFEEAKKIFIIDIKKASELEKEAYKLSPNLENAILNI